VVRGGVDDDRHGKVADRWRKGRARSVARPGDAWSLWDGTRDRRRFRRHGRTGDLDRHRHLAAEGEYRGAPPWPSRGRRLCREGPQPDTQQEVNLDAGETLDFVVVRSDNEKIVVGLDIVPVEQPETVF
jgi:hypothetical protein